MPWVPISVAPTRVQGPGAASEIAAALDLVARHDEVSVVLLVRGGGSLEDLQAFNSEEVARAIAACPVPVIAGVGHEVDLTIACLTADLRAPTPSAAAELALPDRRALQRELRGRFDALHAAARGRVQDAQGRLGHASRALRAHAPAARLRLQRERLGAAARALLTAGRALSQPPQRRLGAAARALLTAGRALSQPPRRRLGEAAARLESLSPLAVLSRGYGLVRRQRDGGIVRDVGDVEVGEALDVELARVRLEARVESLEERRRR
jgi:exodeoxyribonuclease VII large subunit